MDGPKCTFGHNAAAAWLKLLMQQENELKLKKKRMKEFQRPRRSPDFNPIVMRPVLEQMPTFLIEMKQCCKKSGPELQR